MTTAQLLSLLPTIALLLIGMSAAAQTGQKLPSHTLTIEVEGTPEEFWRYFEPVDLATLFKTVGKIPGVQATTPVASWHIPGSKRTVYLVSGDTAQEEIVACTVPVYFQYKVSKFTLPARYFCKHAMGEWQIQPVNHKTRVQWTYTFYPKDFPFFKFLLRGFVNRQWKGYMEESMRNLQLNYTSYRNKR
jgi:hypothetical protein